MAYKIGEVAKLLGISSETVRYYEREGVIRSQKIDQESGYRYYEALDINALMRVRMYRNYGFTLQEAKEMLNTCTLEEIAEVMSKVSLGQLDAPCILYDLNGYYDSLKALLAKMIEKGLSTPQRQQGIRFAVNLEEITTILNKA